METSIESNDPSGLLAAMHDSLSSGAVKWNQLSDTMRACSIPIDLILSSIELLTSERPSDDEMQGGKVLNTSAAHLLIELVQGRQISEIEACQPRASSLFEKLISSPASLSHARLAPKIASSFMLHIYMIKERGTLVTFVRKLFLSRATFAPALSLLETFPELDAELDRPSLLQLLVEAGQEDSAIKWAQRLGGDMQVLLTDTLIAQDRLKAANQAVKVFKLEATFPDVESQYHFKTVTKLIGKKLWSVAIQFAGQDQDLQTMVLRAMVEENEMAAANEFRKLLGLPESSLVIDPDAIRAEEERREATYLQLSSYLSPSQVLWVDGASLSSARDVLLNTSGPVGIDVEWKPTQIGGGGEAGSSRASILQLATEQQVLIFDLVSFSSTPSLTQELDRVLSIVMSDRQRLKLGFEISGDFKVLRASFPTMKCFAQVKGVLDLKHLWFKYLEVSGGGRVKRSAGLSTLCQSLLGKPLDKSMQCSDWQARPLTARQINYAALDSLCLILLFQKFQQVLPAGVMSMVVSSSSYDYSDSAAKGLRDENDDDDNDNDVPQWNQSERDDTAWGSVSMRESSSPPEVPEVIRATLERFGLSNSVVMKIGLPAAGSQVRTLISAEDAAVALGVEPDQIVKSMALWVRSADAAAKGLVCALRGSKRLDLNKVANILGVGRKSLSFASKGECLARFGYASGSLPPFGHIEEVKVLLDKGLREHFSGSDVKPCLFCGVGAMNASLGPISHEQLVSLCMGDEVDIIMDSDMVDERAIEVRDEVNCSFLCDSMLGRPHRWLRCLGIDSVFIGADVSRADVLSLAAKSEGRIFLTRDIKLASRREISHKSCFVLSSQSPEEQLREISRAFGIDFQESEVLSRCPSCGAKAFQEAERESVRDRVSGTVMESISQFFECGVCFQVFWMGPKSEKAIENVKRILCGSSSAEDSLNTLKEEGMVRPEKVLLIN